MAVIGKLWETNPVEYLVQWKFPKLAVFKHAVVRESSSISATEWRDLQDEADAYRRELWAMPEADRQSLIAEAREDELRRYNEYRETQERNQFFNQTTAMQTFRIGRLHRSGRWTRRRLYLLGGTRASLRGGRYRRM